MSTSLVTSSSPSAAVASAAVDIVAETEAALKISSVAGLGANGPFETFCNRLLSETSAHILQALPVIFEHLDSQDVGMQKNAETMMRKIRGCSSNDMVEAILRFQPGEYLQRPEALRHFCLALKDVEGERSPEALWIMLQVLKGASENRDIALNEVACDLLLPSLDPGPVGKIAYLAAIISSQRETPEHLDLSVRYFTDLYKSGYFYHHPILSFLAEPMIARARVQFLNEEDLVEGYRFFKSLIVYGPFDQVQRIPEETVQAWRANSTVEGFSGKWALELLTQYEARVKAEEECQLPL